MIINYDYFINIFVHNVHLLYLWGIKIREMKKLTYKDFKSKTVYGNEVEFLMKDGTTVYVNLEDQTVEIEEELVDDASYSYFIQAAQEIIEEQKQSLI